MRDDESLERSDDDEAHRVLDDLDKAQPTSTSRSATPRVDAEEEIARMCGEDCPHGD